jgi:two-component system NtrC family sensor kinase
MRLSAERAAQIVRNLLQFARETPPTRENVDVNELVERGLQVTANTLVTNNITIVRDLDPAASATVGDTGQLQQVLFNLVTNAYQAMIGVGRTLTVRTRSTRDGVRIEVADSGPGVPADVCAKIFDPFFMTKPVGNRHRARPVGRARSRHVPPRPDLAR